MIHKKNDFLLVAKKEGISRNSLLTMTMITTRTSHFLPWIPFYPLLNLLKCQIILNNCRPNFATSTHWIDYPSLYEFYYQMKQ